MIPLFYCLCQNVYVFTTPILPQLLGASSLIWDIILIIALVAANGFFVAAEFALVKVRQSEIETLAQEGSRLGQITDQILKRLDAYLSACQLGITLASLGLGWYGEVQVAGMLAPVALSFGLPPESAHFVALPIAFGVITFLHITVGEQVPKMLAIQKSRPIALSVSIPLLGFYKTFRPFIWLLNASSNFMLRAVGVPLVSEHGETATETELRLMFINAAAGGHVTRRELSLMENVLDLEDKPARRYMTPRQEIVYLNRYDSMEEKLRIAVESGHTRFSAVRRRSGPYSRHRPCKGHVPRHAHLIGIHPTGRISSRSSVSAGNHQTGRFTGGIPAPPDRNRHPGRRIRGRVGDDHLGKCY